MKAAKGIVFKYGDNVDTDVIIPARYLNSSDPAELAAHCMEDIDKEFIKNVRKGDIIVADKNFGCGSSREHAPIAIKAAGISCVIAETFARIFTGTPSISACPSSNVLKPLRALRPGMRWKLILTWALLRIFPKVHSSEARLSPNSCRKSSRQRGLSITLTRKNSSLPQDSFPQVFTG